MAGRQAQSRRVVAGNQSPVAYAQVALLPRVLVDVVARSIGAFVGIPMIQPPPITLLPGLPNGWDAHRLPALHPVDGLLRDMNTDPTGCNGKQQFHIRITHRHIMDIGVPPVSSTDTSANRAYQCIRNVAAVSAPTL